MTLIELKKQCHELGVNVFVERSVDQNIVSFEIFDPNKSFENGDRIGHNVPFERMPSTEMYRIAFEDMKLVLTDEPVNPENVPVLQGY